jgi:hypothetical protein
MVEFFTGMAEFSSHHLFLGMPNSNVEHPNRFEDAVNL